MNLHHRMLSTLSTKLSSTLLAPLTAKKLIAKKLTAKKLTAKKLTAPLARLVALPLALPLTVASLIGVAGQPEAQAYPWRYNYNSYGSYGQGTLYGPGGYRLQQSHQQNGSFGSGQLRDNRGNTLRYNTNQFGNMYQIRYH